MSDEMDFETADQEQQRQSKKKETDYPELKFRNYLPQDNGLKNSIIERPQIPRLTEEITQKLNQVAGVDPDYMNMTDIAPKKVDDDLKRVIDRKLEKLESRTQRAIVEMVREKLQKKQELTGNSDDISRRIAIEQAEQEAEEE